MKIDNDLVVQVQLKATGANIHKVAGKLSVYKFYAGLGDNCSVESRDRFNGMAQLIEQDLRKFVATGIL